MTENDSIFNKQLSLLGRGGIIGIFFGLLALAGVAMYMNFTESKETRQVIRENTEVMAGVREIMRDLRGSLSIKINR